VINFFAVMRAKACPERGRRTGIRVHFRIKYEWAWIPRAREWRWARQAQPKL